MSQRRRPRSLAPSLADQIDAVLRCPLIHHLGTVVADNGLGRPRHHPPAAHLAFGALARLWRSGARLDLELPSIWDQFVDAFNDGAARADTEPIDPRIGPLTWHHYRRGRARLTEPPTLELLGATFTAQSLRIAHQLGLLRPNGPGSLTHPHPSRVIYGDGTVVRPIYRSRAELDPAAPHGRRYDPDAALHVRHDGTVIGSNFVAICARGPAPRQRVILAVGHTPAPGQEAATAVALIKHVHTMAGSGIQAVVYDGALTGVHIQELMTECGLIVINKVAAAPTPAPLRDAGIKLAKQYPVGVYTHPVNGRPCKHTVIAHAGALVEIDHNDAGELVPLHILRRVQVKRTRRGNGHWHFTLGVEIPCRHGTFVVWVSPHTQRGDTDSRRPENLRLLAEADPDFAVLYGLRNDSESLNASFKRTLLADRAMSLGWRRQLLDLMSYAALMNASAWKQAVGVGALGVVAAC